MLQDIEEGQMRIRKFQEIIRRMYIKRDRRRGLEKNFMWFIEEVGELAGAIKSKKRDEMRDEFADVLAWLITLANIVGIDMEEACRKYIYGCPSCKKPVCRCPSR
jgi:NTP pyrophosphatase (non-canonical NTP hydrolase)